jgi:hypothetical protein
MMSFWEVRMSKEGRPVTPQQVLASVKPLAPAEAKEAFASTQKTVQAIGSRAPLYKLLAREMWRYQNAGGSGIVREDARDTIERLVKEHMPSGSGFDSGTVLVLDESTDYKLVFGTSFHHMNEHGSYTKWTEHRVIVSPSLAFDFDLTVTGRDHNGIKDYIHEVFHHALTKAVSYPDREAKAS